MSRGRSLTILLSSHCRCQVAELLGVNAGTLWNWEGQHSTPALFCIPAIINFLGYNPLPEAENIAARLTRWRLSLGVTQRELAGKLGIDPSTLARWERGERTPTGLLPQRCRKLAVWRSSVDQERLEEHLRQIADYLNGIHTEFENRISRGSTMIGNAYTERMSNIGQIKASLSALRTLSLFPRNFLRPKF